MIPDEKDQGAVLATDQAEPVMSSEQAADFAALMAQADAADLVATPSAPGAPEAPAGVPLAEQLGGLLMALSGILGPMLPTVASIYTPEVCNTVGAAVAPVCEKHGWLQGGIGGKYAEEIMCAAVLAPIAYSTAQAAKIDIAARKAKAIPAETNDQAQADQAAAAAALQADHADRSGKTVTFGNVPA